MAGDGIYGQYRDTMARVMEDLAGRIASYGREQEAGGGEKPYEHLLSRIKGEDSMREKLRRRGFPEDTYHALRSVKDAIGLRLVCRFIDDVYANADFIQKLPGCRVEQVKDYIKNAKPNGYRSYHMILELETPEEDVEGQRPGHYFAEVQIRTIAMDTWAALEHEMKYKKNLPRPELVAQELERCANELASCDVSMQALRRIIREL